MIYIPYYNALALPDVSCYFQLDYLNGQSDQPVSAGDKVLFLMLKNEKQEIFWIDAKQTQHGPLGKEIQLEYQLISSDPKLQEISEKTGLSTTSILKIIAIADVRKSYIFDAHQLAECLGITVRSARRIMNKIMEAGYGKVYAKKTAAAGGRPKALVEILFKI